jgi:hypothetical protein
VIHEGQLSLFDAPPNGDADDADLLEAVRRIVAEPGMSADELQAVVADALGQVGWHPKSPLRPAPCRCLPHGLVIFGARCWKCGRSLERLPGPYWVRPVGATPKGAKQL